MLECSLIGQATCDLPTSTHRQAIPPVPRVSQGDPQSPWPPEGSATACAPCRLGPTVRGRATARFSLNQDEDEGREATQKAGGLRGAERPLARPQCSTLRGLAYAP